MGQFSKVLLAIDNANPVLHRALYLGGLTQIYCTSHSSPSFESICGMYIYIFTRWSDMNQYDILMTVATGQIVMASPNVNN